MGTEVTAEQALSAANELVNDVSDFGDAVKAEVRHHTGGRRKHAYVYIEVVASEWRELALWLKKSKKVDYCSMITGIHWPENADASWQVVVHLLELESSIRPLSRSASMRPRWILALCLETRFRWNLRFQ